MKLPKSHIAFPLFFLLLFGVTNTKIYSEEHNIMPQWQLVWREDFNAEELDESRWQRCQRGEPDWQNTMSDLPSLLEIKDGILFLYGIENQDLQADNSPYLTAGITSKNKFSFQYGKVEIRARFQSAQGAWPALWLKGEEGHWPACGEIDLMEHLNFDHHIHQTLHSTFTVNAARDEGPAKGNTAPIDRDNWNTYGCEWNETEIIFTVNGEPTHTYPRIEELGPEQWPFDQPFYFILSMQIGGAWVNKSGQTNPNDFPASLQIDWIQIHQQHP